MVSSRQFITKAYLKLYSQFGPQYWWPGDSPFEIIVGAILTQNTNWGNVEKAIANLKKAKLLSPRALHNAAKSQIAKHIKPAGYFNVKASRLKSFIDFLFEEYKGSLRLMAKEPLDTLRVKLLEVHGVGPETADSILLYALEKPSFVIDAYTKRILTRHNVIDQKASYHDMKILFEGSLDNDLKLYNEYHALIVRVGKEYCKPKAKCELCPLRSCSYSLQNKCAVCHRALKVKEKKCVVKGSESLQKVHHCVNCASGKDK